MPPLLSFSHLRATFRLHSHSSKHVDFFFFFASFTNVESEELQSWHNGKEKEEKCWKCKIYEDEITTDECHRRFFAFYSEGWRLIFIVLVQCFQMENFQCEVCRTRQWIRVSRGWGRLAQLALSISHFSLSLHGAPRACREGTGGLFHQWVRKISPGRFFVFNFLAY